MKKLFYYLKTLFSGWGTDKWAHLGIGGLACALITIAMILYARQMPHWAMLLIPLGGTICVLIPSFFKELIDSTGFSWMDIIAAMLGCLLVEAAVLFGILIGI